MYAQLSISSAKTFSRKFWAMFKPSELFGVAFAEDILHSSTGIEQLILEHYCTPYVHLIYLQLTILSLLPLQQTFLESQRECFHILRCV